MFMELQDSQKFSDIGYMDYPLILFRQEKKIERQILSSKQTAYAAMPSPRPMKPMPSLVFALMFICPGCSPA
jgi:hypothetical protein